MFPYLNVTILAIGGYYFSLKFIKNRLLLFFMARIKKSEYIIISKKIIRLLLRETCWGKGSMYLDNIKKSGFKDNEVPLVEMVINGLVKQSLVMKKKHKHGWKYFLNNEKREKLFSIAKEIGKRISSLILFYF